MQKRYSVSNVAPRDRKTIDQESNQIVVLTAFNVIQGSVVECSTITQRWHPKPKRPENDRQKIQTKCCTYILWGLQGSRDQLSLIAKSTHNKLHCKQGGTKETAKRRTVSEQYVVPTCFKESYISCGWLQRAHAIYGKRGGVPRPLNDPPRIREKRSTYTLFKVIQRSVVDCNEHRQQDIFGKRRGSQDTAQTIDHKSEQSIVLTTLKFKDQLLFIATNARNKKYGKWRGTQETAERATGSEQMV